MNITKRSLIILLAILMIGFAVSSLLIVNQFIILKRIYYTTTYQGNIVNFENIINKSETFDYQKYCKYRDFTGVHNLSNSDYYYHIEWELIDSLKLKIERDQSEFHVYPFYAHNLVYSLEATNESLIYLTYNSVYIMKAENADHTEVFTGRWEENWYLNFTQIPYVSNSSSTIMLNNSILVKMNLRYKYEYGIGEVEDLIIEQFLCFNSNFQTIFVYIPLTSIIMA